MTIELRASLLLLGDTKRGLVGFIMCPNQKEVENLLTKGFYWNFTNYLKCGVFQYLATNGKLIFDASRSLNKIFTLPITPEQEVALRYLIAVWESYPDESVITFYVHVKNKSYACQRSIIFLLLPNVDEIMPNLPVYLNTLKEI